MKKILFFILLLIFYVGVAQQQYAHKIQLISDNDLYTSLYYDRYYTNGMFLEYSNLISHKKEKIVKKIQSFGLGHMMFTPSHSTVTSIYLHDRPFAGYLFGSYSNSIFYKNQSNLDFGVQIGVIGEHSKAQELQNFIHNIYQFPKAIGWEHQIKNAFALNFTINYLYHFGTDTTNHFDISSVNSLQIGTIFTDISTGILTRLSFLPLQKTYNTSVFKSNLNRPKTHKINKKESFFYLKPSICYALYDATIQGSFLNTSSPVTYKINPINIKLEIGYHFTYKKFEFAYVYNYTTNKVDNKFMLKSNYYGRILLGYLF